MPKYCIKTIANGTLLIEAVNKDYIEVTIEREHGIPHTIGLSLEQFKFLFAMIIRQCELKTNEKLQKTK